MPVSEILSGGDPRSLGKTEEVVQSVLAKQSKLGELFECLWSNDEIVRMRASDALEKICRHQPQWFAVYKYRLLKDVPKIRQPSVQWHLAQILGEVRLSDKEQKEANTILKNNLATMDDWIVTNLTLKTLASFARTNKFPKKELLEILKQYKNDKHKSIVSRTKKLLDEFDMME